MKYFKILFVYIRYMVKHLWWRQYIKCNPDWEPKKMMNVALPSPQETNDLIKSMIDTGAPFSLIRPGNGEYATAFEWIEHRLLRTNRYKRQSLSKTLKYDESVIGRWTDGFVDDISNADIISFIDKPAYNMQFLCRCFSNTDKYMMYYYGTWDQTIINPWFGSLSGKKVLFISPFTETMKKQWMRYDKVCGENKCLPMDMEPVFLQSIWYKGGNDTGDERFDDFFDALEYLKNELNHIEFDIALISCSSFSTFLATTIKKMGKQAIQYGGELQLLFGIVGRRWEDNGAIQRYVNDYWVRPSETERPQGWNKLEGGCYF